MVLKLTTPDIKIKKLTCIEKAFISNWRLGHSGKLQMALGAYQPGFGLVIGPRCWPPGSRPQHIVPDRGEVVTAPILVPSEECYIQHCKFQKHYILPR